MFSCMLATLVQHRCERHQQRQVEVVLSSKKIKMYVWSHHPSVEMFAVLLVIWITVDDIQLWGGINSEKFHLYCIFLPFSYTYHQLWAQIVHQMRPRCSMTTTMTNLKQMGKDQV